EHQLEVRIEIVRYADGRVRDAEIGRILRLRHLHASLDLADRVEIDVERGAVRRTETTLEPRGLLLDAIEDAAGLGHDRGALLVGISLTEQLVEDGARIALLRQRLSRRAPRRLRAALGRRELERRQARILADVPRRELIRGDARVGPDHARVLRRNARQPGPLDEFVRLGALGRLVTQARDDRQVLAERL